MRAVLLVRDEDDGQRRAGSEEAAVVSPDERRRQGRLHGLQALLEAVTHRSELDVLREDRLQVRCLARQDGRVAGTGEEPPRLEGVGHVRGDDPQVEVRGARQEWPQEPVQAGHQPGLLLPHRARVVDDEQEVDLLGMSERRSEHEGDEQRNAAQPHDRPHREGSTAIPH